MKAIIVILFVLFGALICDAQQAEIGHRYAKVLYASRSSVVGIEDRYIISGSERAESIITYGIEVKWGNTTPDSVYFRAADIWQKCYVSNHEKETDLSFIRKSKIYLIALRTISNPSSKEIQSVPKEIDGVATPALFFHIKGKWYYLPVDEIKTAS